MSKIVEFPTKSVRDWLVIEESMNKSFSENDIPEQARERLRKIMKTFYQDTLNVSFNLSTTMCFPSYVTLSDVERLASEIGHNIGALSSIQIQDFTSKLFFERLIREIDICHELGFL